jgi:hypothetical protein
LPVAPMKRSIAADVMPPAKSILQSNASTLIRPMVASALVTAGPPLAPSTSSDLSKKLIEGAPAVAVSQKTSITPRTTPQSPMRLATKAFFAASPASRLSV